MSVVAGLHARDLELSHSPTLQIPYGEGPQNIPDSTFTPLTPLFCPTIPSDLSALPLADLKSLALDLGAYMDGGDPPHQECLPEYERLLAEISAREGCAP